MRKLSIKDGSEIIFEDWQLFLKKNKSVKTSEIIVVTDTNLHAMYGEQLSVFRTIVIEAGEASKNLSTISNIIDQLIEMNATRSTFLLGFGGGVVSDITGFVASVYMRGIDFGFVSTSLLGQLDASVGGKNGVNFSGLKNIIGTFNQPKFVVIDTSMLATLPVSEFISGIAEAYKMSLIMDKDLALYLESFTINTIMQGRDHLERIIYRCVELKADVVADDYREQGDRRKLNFGHTFGHAIEKQTSQFSHGEAVAIGMAIAAKISMNYGLLDKQSYSIIVNTLENLSLPTSVSVPYKELLEYIIHDKKRVGNEIDFVFLDSIGSCVVKRVELKSLLKYI